MARFDDLRSDTGPGGNGDQEQSIYLPEPIDWDALFKRETKAEWLVEDIWPAGRQLHIFAARKMGKSLLMLWIAANLAAGRDPFSGRQRERIIVVYLDFEMSEDDLLERVEEMGFNVEDLDGWLIYYLWPTLPPLDTYDGGTTLMRLIERDNAAALVVDTVSRVVVGEENSNDTFRNFFIYTGMKLKREGIALARLDHEGHEGKHARGASAKGDDVDVVWRLTASDGGLTLTKKAARVSWIPERVELGWRNDQLGFERTEKLWPRGTETKAEELNAVGAPLDVSKRQARKLLAEGGFTPGTNEIILKAIAYRKQRAGDDVLIGSKT